MTREQILKACPRASEDTIRKTLELHSHQPVARLGSTQPKQNRRRESEDRSMERSKEGVRVVVSITSFRKRRLDSHDNLAAAHKALVDRITLELGFDTDDHPRLEWEYAQVITQGRQGTHVGVTAL